MVSKNFHLDLDNVPGPAIPELMAIFTNDDDPEAAPVRDSIIEQVSRQDPEFAKIMQES